MIAMAAAVVLGTGCKKKAPEPAPIYQYYDVQYFTDQNKTRADAYLTYWNSGGMNVRFADMNAVKANGEATQALPNSDGEQFFDWDIAGTPDITFTIARKDGTTLTNKVNRAMMGDIQMVIDSVLYTTDIMRVRWTGTPLQQDESIGIAMNRVYDSTGLWSGASGELYEPDQYIRTFSYNETSKLYPGIYEVGLAKTRKIPLQQHDGIAGGTIQVSIGVTKRVVVK